MPAGEQGEIRSKVKFKRCPKSIGTIRFGMALICGQMLAKNGRNLGAAARLSGLAAFYPRIHKYLPAKRILEIAPGFGRWTRFLIPSCEELKGIDLSSKCAP
jgi:hypothetical protein